MPKNLISGHSHLLVKDYLTKEDEQPKVQLVKIGKKHKREENKVVWSSVIEDAKQTVDYYLDR